MLSRNEETESWQHLVIGSGIAGLSLALKLAAEDKVLLIAKAELSESNSRYAQGGIATVLGSDDTFEKHVRDTIDAGAGLCRTDVVARVVERGPKVLNDLIDLGAKFTEDSAASHRSANGYHLNREGGHSTRRVIHADDATGLEVIRVLTEKVRAHKNIVVREGQMAINLLTSDKYAPTFRENECLGAYVLDCASGKVTTVLAARTYLCTGGHGKVYQFTSNPDLATGDGLAMGWRAGCKVANLEFMQFHPTCLYDPQNTKYLITEAMRGEGAVLRSSSGQDFMLNYDQRGSLAPRDIVARAIDTELKRTGESHVFLDATVLGNDRLQSLFPKIMLALQESRIDPGESWIPVVPAAHYSCGGLVVDEYGETAVRNLYALGEVACTGLHGANRLASNSLLEALVYADIVAHRVRDQGPATLPNVKVPPWERGDAVPADELVLLPSAWDEIRRLMWNYVGIVRSNARLDRAETRIQTLVRELDEFYWQKEITPEILEVRNLAQVASLTIRSARARKESRGIHFNIDYSEKSSWWERDTVLF